MQTYSLKKVIISPYDKKWVNWFEEEKKKLKKVFKNIEMAFYHIGSTSIPECCAKPTIDILGVTPDILKIDSFNQEMISLGFTPLGEYGMKQRRFFYRKNLTPINLHIFEETDPEVGRHLRFRNYLRSHPDKIKEYSDLKQQLAKQFPHDIQRYTIGKEKFIKSIDIEAAWQTSPETSEEKEKPKKETWDLEEIIHAMEVNMHLQMIYFAKYIPFMEIVFEPDVTVVRSQIPDDTFNYVLSAHFTEENAPNRILHVLDHYKQFHLPFSWWVSESDSPSTLGDLLLNQGFTLKEKNIGMYIDLSTFHFSPTTSPLSFHRIESSLHLKAFADVIVAIQEFEEPLQLFDLIYSHLPPVIYRGKSSLEMYVAYLEDIPVVTGILVTHANVAGIYYVATIPEQRKKGIGTAMMQFLLNRAKEKGYFISVLQASDQGLSLYERLGYKRCCQFLEYAPNKP